MGRLGTRAWDARYFAVFRNNQRSAFDTAERRRDALANTDVLYVHDTLELFANSLDELRALWQSQLRAAVSARVARRTVRTGRGLFREVTDTIREAALIPQDRRPRPENIRGLCHLALEAIFGQPT